MKSKDLKMNLTTLLNGNKFAQVVKVLVRSLIILPVFRIMRSYSSVVSRVKTVAMKCSCSISVHVAGVLLVL